MSVEPFNRLVKLAARAFYDEIPLKADNQPKIGRSDNKGIAVVILDALTRRQWVREEDLAKDLKLHAKQLRRTLRFFEEEKLITRDHRKETAKGAKVYNAAVAAVGDSQHSGREGDEKIKMHTHSYCCLDYAQVHPRCICFCCYFSFVVVQLLPASSFPLSIYPSTYVVYRLHRMRKKLKDELDDKNKVQEYICPNCGKRYTALDAGRLVSMEDFDFHCEVCSGVLVAENEKLAGDDFGDADEDTRRRNNNRVQDKLNKIEVQLKPLIEQLNRVKDLAAPEFGNLLAWEARASAAARAANGGLDGGDPSRFSQGLGFGTPMPYVGETKVEVAFSGIEEKGDKSKSESSSTPMKVLPPWMIKEGMKLTSEQRGAVKEEVKMDGSSVTERSSEDKKSVDEKDDEKKLQDEYLKAYYAAVLQRQRGEEEAAKMEQESSDFKTSNGFSSNERQVGIKSKRDDDTEGADIEWEEAPAGKTSKTFKVDLNVQADATVEDDEEEDEDIWEDG